MSGASKAIILGAMLFSISACDSASAPDTASNASADAKPVPVSKQCDGLPTFLQVYPKAVVLGCYNGTETSPTHQSGTMVFVTQATPKELIDYYQHSAQVVNIPEIMHGRTMYSARDGGGRHRSLMMMMEPDPSGMKVTVNWGQDIN